MRSPAGQHVASDDMASRVRAVEDLLNYRFKDKKLLEAALTHPSYADAESYQRLEFFGDAALGLAISKEIFFDYPDVDQGKLTLLRSVNISTEKLARVAVRHDLYQFVRRKAVPLDETVEAFVIAVEKEDEPELYGGSVPAPKVLADIVESVAAAVYVDCKFDLEALWAVFSKLLEPIVTLDALLRQPQPVTMLNDLCQKNGMGRRVRFEYEKEGDEYVAFVIRDGISICSASSEKKKNAELHAAKKSLEKLFGPTACREYITEKISELNETGEIEGAKQKLNDRYEFLTPSSRVQALSS
ncbi:hypothetical protein RJ640_004735 [Escallonia rubra]|uniref:Uncharacterized protein n=1 Tax=Escallonia rubra TaxID=112253 RepID=A0AA88QQ62_9ASTE|nr:hypothetical protein RJ640_004735 [Escallonia rubra]